MGEADGVRDRPRRAGMVARNHDNPDAGCTALRYRLRDLGPRGVLETDHSRENEIGLPVLLRRVIGQFPVSKGQHPQASRRHFLLGIREPAGDFPGQRLDALRRQHLSAQRKQRLGRTFAVKLWPTLILMRQGTELARVVRPTTSGEVEALFSA